MPRWGLVIGKWKYDVIFLYNSKNTTYLICNESEKVRRANCKGLEKLRENVSLFRGNVVLLHLIK